MSARGGTGAELRDAAGTDRSQVALPGFVEDSRQIDLHLVYHIATEARSRHRSQRANYSQSQTFLLSVMPVCKPSPPGKIHTRSDVIHSVDRKKRVIRIVVRFREQVDSTAALLMRTVVGPKSDRPGSRNVVVMS